MAKKVVGQCPKQRGEYLIVEQKKVKEGREPTNEEVRLLIDYLLSIELDDSDLEKSRRSSEIEK